MAAKRGKNIELLNRARRVYIQLHNISITIARLIGLFNKFTFFAVYGSWCARFPPQQCHPAAILSPPRLINNQPDNYNYSGRCNVNPMAAKISDNCTIGASMMAAKSHGTNVCHAMPSGFEIEILGFFIAKLWLLVPGASPVESEFSASIYSAPRLFSRRRHKLLHTPARGSW